MNSGAAILAACIVQTLNESDPTFQARFLERLGRAQRRVRDDLETPLVDTETLAWTMELLTGFSHGGGQRKPFLSD